MKSWTSADDQKFKKTKQFYSHSDYVDSAKVEEEKLAFKSCHFAENFNEFKNLWFDFCDPF